jgi:hypothetical protein
MQTLTSIILGETYTDRITGFEGVAICVTFWENGCVRAQLERGDKHHKAETEVFDEQRLVLKDEVQAKAGGGREPATRAADPH